MFDWTCLYSRLHAALAADGWLIGFMIDWKIANNLAIAGFCCVRLLSCVSMPRPAMVRRQPIAVESTNAKVLGTNFHYFAYTYKASPIHAAHDTDPKLYCTSKVFPSSVLIHPECWGYLEVPSVSVGWYSASVAEYVSGAGLGKGIPKSVKIGRYTSFIF